MKVLSIDFDYFQKVDVETLRMFYPDGVDLDTKLSSAVWSSKYAFDYENKLNSVIINEKEFDKLKEIISNQNSSVPVMITNSHVHAYEFVKNHFRTDNELELVNVDMHHDYINGNENLDCGNWIGHIMNDYPDCKFSWIMNPTSIEMYGLEKGKIIFPKELLRTSLDSIENEKYDLIFICRSDNWTPPHLDPFFKDLVIHCVFTFDKINCHSDVIDCRDITETVEKLKAVYKKLQDEMTL